MKRGVNFQWKLGCALLVGMGAAYPYSAFAGWTGAVNPLGIGSASVNVVSSVGTSSSVGTPLNTSRPSAAITPATGYTYSTDLPIGANSSTYSRVKTSTALVLQATTAAYGGDHTGNTAIDSILTVTPGPNPMLNLSTSSIMNPDGRSGLIQVLANGTLGTALLVRGFEYLGTAPPNFDDFNTPDWRPVFNELFAGPFNTDDPALPASTIAFSVQTDINNFYLVADGEAVSTTPEAGSTLLTLAVGVASLAPFRRSARR